MPNKPGLLLPALYGGIIIGVIRAVPGLNLLNCCFCAGIMVGGIAAVFFFHKDLLPGMPPLASSDGLKLGLLAGTIGAVLSLILPELVELAFGRIASEIEMNIFDTSAFLSQMPPGTAGELEKSTEVVGAMKLAGTLVVNPLFGLIGGLIGYAIFKPKTEPLPRSIPVSRYAQAPPVPPAQNPPASAQAARPQIPVPPQRPTAPPTTPELPLSKPRAPRRPRRTKGK